MPQQSRTEIEQRFWDGFAGKYDRFIDKRVAKDYAKMLDMLIEDTHGSQHLLEIAAGTGIWALKLSDRIPKITATDLSPEMIKIAKEKATKQSVSNITFQVEDSCNMTFPDNSFDTILASNVLHLLFEPGTALREMKRVLMQDGKIIIPTYCHGQSWMSTMISRMMGLSGFKARSRWSDKTFIEFVKQNGLEPIRVEVLPGHIPFVYLVTKEKGLNKEGTS
jgi:ubiquinone/menaquinone biosynthesis C-methylase UbiE